MLVWLMWFAVILTGALAAPNPEYPSADHHSIRKDAPMIDSAKRQVRQAAQCPAGCASNYCPLGCPKGWKRFGLSTNCYLLAPQPAEGNTFWEWDRRCKATESTSYIMVIDGVFEQAAATIIALTYAPTFLANLGTSYLWLGGYTDERGWKFLDGTDQTGSILNFAAGAVTAVSGKIRNNTCLSGTAWTLGAWETRDCGEVGGTAWCEMPMKPICGGSSWATIIPLPPIVLNFDTIRYLFPKMPSIPYLSQILDATGISSAFNYVGDTLKCYLAGAFSDSPNGPTPLPPTCRWDCPAGWFTYGNVNSSTSQCYLVPSRKLDTLNGVYQGLAYDQDTFTATQGKCQANDATANLLVINSMLELSLIKSLLETFQWQKTNPGAFLWLGEYAKDNAWAYLDNSGEKGSLLTSLANLPSSPANGNCLAANLSNGGQWYQAPCQSKGMSICEMPRKKMCGDVPGGTNIDFLNVTDISYSRLQEMFPKMPDVPFLDDVLLGRHDDDSANQVQAQNGNDPTVGTSLAYVMCVKMVDGWFTSYVSWEYLKINGEVGTMYGAWTQNPCNLRPADAKYAFKVSATSALSAWSRCFNKGYELAMPVYKSPNSLVNFFTSAFTGWYPFQVGNRIAEFYTTSQVKVAESADTPC